MKNNTLLITFVLALVVGGSAFYGGMRYQQSKSQSRSGNFQGRFGGPIGTSGARGQFGQGGQNFRPVSGEILNQDDKSITVKLQDGSSKIVFIAATTLYTKSSEATKSDLKVGDRVAVIGSQNPDGSVTAQNVQLNPMLRQAPTDTNQNKLPTP